MNKTLGISLMIAIVIIGVLVLFKQDIPLGGTQIIGSTYYGATNTSSSVPTVATTTSPILSLDAARTNAVVCNNSVNTVFLHQKSEATTTGVILDNGIPLSKITPVVVASLF